MEPIAETTEALLELGRYADGDLLAELRRTSEAVRSVAPDCVGMSVVMHEHGVTLAFVATPEEAAAQHALAADRPSTSQPAPPPLVDPESSLDEGRWRLLASVSAAAGILSSLSLPVVLDDEVVAVVNLYGASVDAFRDRSDRLAGVVGAWAGGVVTNADLSFGSRDRARQAPRTLQQSSDVDLAVGLVAASHGCDPVEARALLVEAAVVCEVTLAVLAGALVGTHNDRHTDPPAGVVDPPPGGPALP